MKCIQNFLSSESITFYNLNLKKIGHRISIRNNLFLKFRVVYWKLKIVHNRKQRIYVFYDSFEFFSFLLLKCFCDLFYKFFSSNDSSLVKNLNNNFQSLLNLRS